MARIKVVNNLPTKRVAAVAHNRSSDQEPDADKELVFSLPPDELDIGPVSAEERVAWKKENEREALCLFLDARTHVTGEALKVRSSGESPDFVVRRASGSYAGVELTRVFFNEPDPNCAGRSYDWSKNPAIVEKIWRLLLSKQEVRDSATSGWKYRLQTILVLLLMDVSLVDVVSSLDGIPLVDCREIGFREIWVADMDLEAIDAFDGDIRLYGLFPKKWRGFHERKHPHRKPWG